MNYLLPKLQSKEEIDNVVIDVEDKVVVLRFGRENDTICMKLDEIVCIIFWRN